MTGHENLGLESGAPGDSIDLVQLAKIFADLNCQRMQMIAKKKFEDSLDLTMGPSHDLVQPLQSAGLLGRLSVLLLLVLLLQI